jgi:hypothetical protein
MLVTILGTYISAYLQGCLVTEAQLARWPVATVHIYSSCTQHLFDSIRLASSNASTFRCYCDHDHTEHAGRLHQGQPVIKITAVDCSDPRIDLPQAACRGRGM